MTKLRVLSLFAGIGGFDLGLERTQGFETVAFCEIDPFCRRVLAKHWPKVPCYEDVRELTAERLRADGIVPDVIAGGFPCQDISLAGRAAGIEGERSGLWSEYARLVREIRPRFVIVENVSALLGRGLGDVLGDLAEIGYDTEWHCIPAASIGAPHRRDRVWIVAYADGISRNECRPGHPSKGEGGQPPRSSRGSENDLANASIRRYWVAAQQIPSGRHGSLDSDWWGAEPNVGRVAHGVPRRVDRLKCLGNAVVPQIPELIGRAILASLEQARLAA
jgi:DNA (cytosine-5)-methyltransferase 1